MRSNDSAEISTPDPNAMTAAMARGGTATTHAIAAPSSSADPPKSPHSPAISPAMPSAMQPAIRGAATSAAGYDGAASPLTFVHTARHPIVSPSDAALFDALAGVTTATLTTILLKKGLRNVWIRGAFPLAPGTQVVGRAFTVRFVPAREDLATPASWASPVSTRAALEAMPDGCVAVVDAMGIRDAGIWGDILCARMAKRRVAGLVTDGVMRDLAGVLGTGLPVWAAGAAAPPSVAGLTFVDWQQPIGCGGVAVFPDDLIVADQDGAVVVPHALVAGIVDDAVEQERFEGWIVQEVNGGAVLPGLYPANEHTRARYEAWKAQRG